MLVLLILSPYIPAHLPITCYPASATAFEILNTVVCDFARILLSLAVVRLLLQRVKCLEKNTFWGCSFSILAIRRR